MSAQTQPQTGKAEFVFSRTFDAPRDKVFRAWAEEERMARWWGPKGYDLEVKKFDFTPGGYFHYLMRNKAGGEMWGRFEFREIDEPNRLVFINGFSNPEGTLARAPWFDDKWPLEVLSEVEFTEMNGKTTVALKAHPINATPEEEQLFISQFASMQGGYGGTFDVLTDYLTED